MKLFPVMCGSAFKNKGVQPLLDAVVDYLPSPLDIPPVKGIDPETADKKLSAPADDNEPFSALAFKIMTDPFVGQLAFYPCVLRPAQTGRQRVHQSTQRQARAHRPPAEDARQQA